MSFQCGPCSRAFTSKAALESHCAAKGHPIPPQAYACPIQGCQYSSHIAEGLQSHFSAKHPRSKLHHCPGCTTKFLSPGSRINHIFVAHPNLFCSRCREVFETEEEKFLHEGTKHPSAMLYCDVCLVSVKLDTWKKHWTEEAKHKFCDHCEEYIESKAKYLQHFTQTHPQVYCSLCSFSLFKDDWERHWKESEKHRLCSRCDLAFENKDEYSKHAVGSHRLSCEFCPKDFPTEEVLKAHIESSPWHHKCHTCNVRFSAEWSLTVHNKIRHPSSPGQPTSPPIRIKSPTAPLLSVGPVSLSRGIECAVCHVHFKDASSQIQHMIMKHPETQSQVPAGKGPFSCPPCQRLFQSLSALQQHVLSRHGGEFPDSPSTPTMAEQQLIITNSLVEAVSRPFVKQTPSSELLSALRETCDVQPMPDIQKQEDSVEPGEILLSGDSTNIRPSESAGDDLEYLDFIANGDPGTPVVASRNQEVSQPGGVGSLPAVAPAHVDSPLLVPQSVVGDTTKGGEPALGFGLQLPAINIGSETAPSPPAEESKPAEAASANTRQSSPSISIGSWIPSTPSGTVTSSVSLPSSPDLVAAPAADPSSLDLNAQTTPRSASGTLPESLATEAGINLVEQSSEVAPTPPPPPPINWDDASTDASSAISSVVSTRHPSPRLAGNKLPSQVTRDAPHSLEPPALQQVVSSPVPPSPAKISPPPIVTSGNSAVAQQPISSPQPHPHPHPQPQPQPQQHHQHQHQRQQAQQQETALPDPPSVLVVRCGICAKSPPDALVTMCGHIFCHGCAMAEISKTLNCPTCKRVMFVRLDFGRL